MRYAFDCFCLVCVCFVKNPPRKWYIVKWVGRESAVASPEARAAPIRWSFGAVRASPVPTTPTCQVISVIFKNIIENLMMLTYQNHPKSTSKSPQPKWSKMEGVGRGGCFSWAVVARCSCGGWRLRVFFSAGLILPTLLFHLVPPNWWDCQIRAIYFSSKKLKDTVTSKSTAKLWRQWRCRHLTTSLSNEGGFSMKSCQSDTLNGNLRTIRDHEFPAPPFL